MKNKKLLLFIFLIGCSIQLLAQPKMQTQAPTPKPNGGADGAEMKTYVMVFLKAGPNRKQPKAEAEVIQEQHMNHIKQMSDEGFLFSAGPFLDAGEVKGILIFNVENIEQIKDQVNQDPAIKAGRLIAEFHRWMAQPGVVFPN